MRRGREPVANTLVEGPGGLPVGTGIQNHRRQAAITRPSLSVLHQGRPHPFTAQAGGHHERLDNRLAGLLQGRSLENMQQPDNLSIDNGYSDAVIRCFSDVIEPSPNLLRVELVAELAQQVGYRRQVGGLNIANDHCVFVLPGPFAATVGVARLAC